jgi:hypothetical protein
VLAEPVEGCAGSVAELVQLGKDRLVRDLTIHALGHRDQELGGCR